MLKYITPLIEDFFIHYFISFYFCFYETRSLSVVLAVMELHSIDWVGLRLEAVCLALAVLPECWD